MANHASALKRVRQTRRRTERNRASTHRVRTAVRRLRDAVARGDKSAAQQLLAPTVSALDKAIQKGVLHHRAADRYKSKLSLAVNKLA